jgi:regulator of nucleoside diphosphate kinase
VSALLVTEADYANLSLLESPKLRRRLAGATRVPSVEAPGELVTMNSIVRYRLAATGERREVQLVYPQDARSGLRNRCSVLSALGLALLGTSAGDRVALGSGQILIEEVLHQPESSLQKHLFVRG